MHCEPPNNEPCPLCGCPQSVLFLSRRSRLGDRFFHWVRCRGCGVIRVAPLPDDDDIEQMYSDEEYVESDSIAGNAAGRSAIEDLIYQDARGQLQELSEFVATGRLLDVGCAHGEFLQAADDMGFEAEGLEPNPTMAQAARNRGFPLRQTTVEQADLKPGSYEIINLNHILEHVSRPGAIMQKVAGALTPGGIVHIRVPSALNALYFKVPVHLVRLTRRLGIRGVWEGGKPPYHLWEFTPRHIRSLLQQAGLDVVYSRADEGLPRVSFGGTPGANLWHLRRPKDYLRVALSYPLKALSVAIAKSSSWGDQTEAVARKPGG